MAAGVSAFRAPHGRFSWEVRTIAVLVGMPHLIGWDVGPQHDDIDPVSMAAVIVQKTTSGSIINLHDGLAGKDHDVSARVSRAAADCVDLVVPRLLALGFRFKTVSEMVGKRSAQA